MQVYLYGTETTFEIRTDVRKDFVLSPTTFNCAINRAMHNICLHLRDVKIRVQYQDT